MSVHLPNYNCVMFDAFRLLYSSSELTGSSNNEKNQNYMQVKRT